MTEESGVFTRRSVLAMGAALLSQGWWIRPAASTAEPGAATVPTRRFGRSARRVPILGLGGYFDTVGSQDLLALAFERGVTYWEATLAKGGEGYGDYFRRHPAHRERVFLLAKSREASRESLEKHLARALREASTGYVDFFVVQGVSDPQVLSPALGRWAEAQKAAGRIRHFGFSTHANMVACLGRAAGLPWIDGVVTACNYRLLEIPEMRGALEACARAGIALTAIKTQALPSNPAAEIGDDTPEARRSLDALAGGEGDLAGAKLRSVWSNPSIASALSLMPDAPRLEANCRAARQPEALSRRDRAHLAGHARATASAYCAGCARLCESRVSEPVPIQSVMRYLMYARGYGDLERARRAFAALPEPARRALRSADYRRAESVCPQGIAIGSAMRRASTLLA